jgi:hypothetical protein
MPEPFRVPDLQDRAGVRWTDRDKQNLRILMASRRVTSVSDIIKWALEEQAAPVRERWNASGGA